MKLKSGTALYHVVKPHENFDTSAKLLFKLIVESQKSAPNSERHIYMDIEGHRNEEGGYDQDMFELQTHFLSFILPYITTVSTPLTKLANPKNQINVIPFTDLTIPS